MATIPLGTIATVFNNTFIYTDPQYVNGLQLWRQLPAVPESTDVTGLGGILPVVVQQETAQKTVNVSFNIVGLPLVTSKSQQAQAYSLLQQPYNSLPGFAPKAQSIRTLAPVRHVTKSDAAVLYFDIKSVPRAEIGSEGNMYSSYGSRKNKISVKPYNGSNGVNITSEAPMVDEVLGDTATFSFDITKLPKV